MLVMPLTLKKWHRGVQLVALRPEVGTYKRKQESNKERKHAFDQESDQEKTKKR